MKKTKVKKKREEKDFTGLFNAKLPAILAIFFFITLIASQTASADVIDSLRAIPSGIGGALNNYASTDAPSVIDFLLFAILFFALCWIGFNNVFKESKNANVVLSLALGTALAIALVYGGKFTVKKLLPFAAIILFLLLIVGIYALLKKFIFTKDTVFSKIISIVLALLVALAILIASWHFICSDNNCDNNAFMRKILGSESIVGRLFEGITNAITGVVDGGADIGAAPTDSTTEAGQQVQQPTCGDGQKTGNEECELGRGEAREGAVACQEGYACGYDCECVPDSTAGVIFAHMGQNWIWYLIALACLALFGTGIAKRKWLKEKVNNELERRKNKKNSKKVKELLGKISGEEKEITNRFSELCNHVREERSLFDSSRQIIDRMTHDIKQTIGEEISFLGQQQINGRSFDHHVALLQTHNTAEKIIVLNNIIPAIDNQLRQLGELGKEIREELDALRGAEKVFKQNDETLQALKQFDLREQGFVTKMQQRINENRQDFEAIQNSCTEMEEKLRHTEESFSSAMTAQGSGAQVYLSIIAKVRDIRFNSIKANRLLSQKIDLLRHLSAKLKEVEQEIHELHQQEIEHLRVFLDEAEASFSSKEYAKVVYFATHVLESIVEFSNHPPEGLEQGIAELRSRAERVIVSSLPNVIGSVQDEMISAMNQMNATSQPLQPDQLGPFDKIRGLAESLSNVSTLFRAEHERKFRAQLVAHEDNMKKLKELCDALDQQGVLRQELQELLDKLNKTNKGTNRAP